MPEVLKTFPSHAEIYEPRGDSPKSCFKGGLRRRSSATCLLRAQLHDSICACHPRVGDDVGWLAKLVILDHTRVCIRFRVRRHRSTQMLRTREESTWRRRRFGFFVARHAEELEPAREDIRTRGGFEPGPVPKEACEDATAQLVP